MATKVVATRVVRQEEVEAEPAKRPAGRPKGTGSYQQIEGEGSTPAEPVPPHLELHDAIMLLVKSRAFKELLPTVPLWWLAGAAAQSDDD
jgi:hypothetical protein